MYDFSAATIPATTSFLIINTSPSSTTVLRRIWKLFDIRIPCLRTGAEN